jgi:2-polyprenyl-3-methyl-5-hydroxy-6-metoxy-1,4-benzoquinol methylase
METHQQKETLKYFETHADDWLNKAKKSGSENLNMIKQRNDCVLDVIKNDRENTKSLLDVGCGTGDLVCDAAKLGVSATGIDFAEEMIINAKKNAADNNIKNTVFECGSIFDMNVKNKKFDIISANGFIEYISYEQLDDFFDIVSHALLPNGSFVFGSRNRLFNIISFNEFTLQELNKPDFTALMEEAVFFSSSKGIENISKLKIPPLQEVDTKHSKTGINVQTRFQFTPHQLLSMLNDKGFQSIGVYPIHIHNLPMAMKNRYPQIHASVSNSLQPYGKNHTELIPFSSSFMLHVKK